MNKFLLIPVFTIMLLISGCANVGFDGVEVNPDDTWFTITTPVVILLLLYISKKEIDLWYLKKELRIRKKEGFNNDGLDS